MSVSIVAHELRALYDQTGTLTPAVVVDAARPEGSPLHSRFEWDDQVAGEKYRHVQAAHLIRSVKVVIQRDGVDETTRVRAFVHLDAEPDSDELGTYVPQDVVASSVELTAMALRQMERRWKELRRTYQAHAEFWSMIERDLAA